MELSLARGVFCCVHDDRAILLDVERDRYFGLDPRRERALLRLARGQAPTDDDRRALASLVGQGILQTSADRAAVPILTVPPPIAASALDGDRCRRVGPLAVARTAAALIGASTTLRWRSLAAALAAFPRRDGGRDGATTLDPMVDLAIDFEHARRWLPIERSCLRDSLALLALARKRERPRLVFGVRTDPFRAHCWVQDGPTLLNEMVDHARLFTPIMIH